MSDQLIDTWHKGEILVQQRAGTDKKMAEIGPKFVRQFMPKQHIEFFQSLNMVFIAFSDQLKQIQASVLYGLSGFIYSPSETQLIINTQQTMGDDINFKLQIGDKIGLVGIEFHSKRRNRVNAIITDINQVCVKLKVLQSYGNCPQYIQNKIFYSNKNYGVFTNKSSTHLSLEDQSLIKNADTFFIASTFDDGKYINNRGSDMSHRGGEAGFITINESGQLVVPDYPGNGFFNTMGNLVLNPIACLLFVDWKKGTILQITVSTKIYWLKKTQRVLNFSPLKIERITNGSPYLQSN